MVKFSSSAYMLHQHFLLRRLGFFIEWKMCDCVCIYSLYYTIYAYAYKDRRRHVMHNYMWMCDVFQKRNALNFANALFGFLLLLALPPPPRYMWTTTYIWWCYNYKAIAYTCHNIIIIIIVTGLGQTMWQCIEELLLHINRVKRSLLPKNIQSRYLRCSVD